jgi:hypothetical protein
MSGMYKLFLGSPAVSGQEEGLALSALGTTGEGSSDGRHRRISGR